MSQNGCEDEVDVLAAEVVARGAQVDQLTTRLRITEAAWQAAVADVSKLSAEVARLRAQLERHAR